MTRSARSTIANEAVSAARTRDAVAFLVDEPDDPVSFLATRAGNVIRAGVPPDRIRDVVVVVPSVGGAGASGERGALEGLDGPRPERGRGSRSGRRAAVFVLTPFDEVDRPTDALVVDPSRPVKDFDAGRPPRTLVGRRDRAGRRSRRSRCSGGRIRLGADGLEDAITAAAAAPAVGAAMLILVATALDAIGVSRSGRRPARSRVSARRRRRVPRSGSSSSGAPGRGAAPQIEEQPAE